MKGRPVDQLVYEAMYPRPRNNDPQNFHAFLQRNLIPEVRQETHAFFGHLDTPEAKYPGLDYNHRVHRIRLGRWPWHRRLFRAFEALALTPAEISGLTKWEGTLWAKEKYEREQGVKIVDTTDEGFPSSSDIPDPPARREHSYEASRDRYRTLFDQVGDRGVESEEDLESVGVELNERLRTQAARREAGDVHAVLDEEWEQWLKNALDSGELFSITERLFRPGADTSAIAPGLFPAGMLETARAGHWSQIPEYLHSMLRRSLQLEAGTPAERAAGRYAVDYETQARWSLPPLHSRSSRRRRPSASYLHLQTWMPSLWGARDSLASTNAERGPRTTQAPGA